MNRFKHLFSICNVKSWKNSHRLNARRRGGATRERENAAAVLEWRRRMLSTLEFSSNYFANNVHEPPFLEIHTFNYSLSANIFSLLIKLKRKLPLASLLSPLPESLAALFSPCSLRQCRAAKAADPAGPLCVCSSRA